MSKTLTKEIIAIKTKNHQIERIKTLNLWGNDIEDISIISQMPSLEIVSLSLNKIRTLQPFNSLPNLKELYLRQNLIADFSEIYCLRTCPKLEVLWLSENPIADNPNYRRNIINILPGLQKLDNQNITDNERIMAQQGDSYDEPRYNPPSRRGVMSQQQHNRYHDNYNQINRPQRANYDNRDYYMQNMNYDNQYADANNCYNRMDNRNQEYYQPIPNHVSRHHSAKHLRKDSDSTRDFQGSNVMNCLVMLLNELNDNELAYIKEEIDKKISDI